ncbi:MAG: hypothetical protein IMX00_04430 [Limnochordales bacterium]|nr:hypothetical protein [Limnochordales bacterium]
MRQKGLRGKQVADAIPIHHSEVSKILRGKRPAITPLMREIAHVVKSAKLWQVVTYEATEGLFTSPWPDGVGRDIHPAVAYLRSVVAAKEASQARDLLRGFVTRLCDSLTPDDVEVIKKQLLALIADHRWDQTLISAVCDWAGIDVVQLYRKHDEMLLLQHDVSWRKAA